MSTIIKFFDRKLNQQFTIDTLMYTYLMDIYTLIKSRQKIQEEAEIQVYCTMANIDGSLKQQFFTKYNRLDEMINMINTKKIKHFELYYKSTEHGKQKEDMKPCEYGKVISGYQRYINKDGEETVVGDMNGGAYITIPKGALSESANISIQTIEVNDSFFGSNGMKNVTKGVGYNPKANNFINNNYK